MEFAVNYSPLLADMIRAGQVKLNCFKCPAWPDLIEEARQLLPVYIHFPLEIGWGRGTAYDSERDRPADLGWFADLKEATGTPLFNTHLFPAGKHHPDIPLESREPRHVRQIVDAALRDLEPVIQRFGAERVIIENAIGENGRLLAGVLPETFHMLLEETGCGFLFDQSHARLSARSLGLSARDYIEMLPLHRVREVHVTGLQMLSGRWMDMLTAAGDPGGVAAQFGGQWMDHLPMTDDDWPEMEWMMQQIHSGKWAEPWVISFEYGGVGGFWEVITERSVYQEQLPRMSGLVAGSDVQLSGSSLR